MNEGPHLQTRIKVVAIGMGNTTTEIQNFRNEHQINFLMKRVRLTHRKGPYQIHAEALVIGEDLVISIWGGSRPHVGAVALAIPRPSLKDPAVIGSTSSVLTRLGHKEDDIVKRVSERVSAALNRVVVVSAGIHWDDISQEEIGTIQSVCETLTNRLIDRILEERE